jgi:hypothetical protein
MVMRSIMNWGVIMNVWTSARSRALRRVLVATLSLTAGLAASGDVAQSQVATPAAVEGVGVVDAGITVLDVLQLPGPMVAVWTRTLDL